MNKNFENDVQRQLTISELEEKYSVEIAEHLTSPEEKLKALNNVLMYIVTDTFLKCLKAEALSSEQVETMMHTLQDEACPKEKREALIKEIAYKLGIPVLMPLTEDLMNLTQIFTSEK